MNPPRATSTAEPGRARPTRGVWRARLAVGALVCLFAVAFWQRNRIRAHWWASRLARTSAADPAAQARYLSSLAAVGADATGAVGRLARHERPEVRALAIVVLARLPGPGALSALGRLVFDDDLDLAESAALSLAFMDGRPSRRLLFEAVGSDRPQGAAAAAAALSRVAAPEALTVLADAVVTHPHARVRAQAVESLAAWLLSAPGPIASRPSSGPSNGTATSGSAMLDSTGALNSVDMVGSIDALVAALCDRATFSGRLSLEREIDAAQGIMAGPPGMPRVKTSPAPGVRRVCDVAATGLTRLTGRPIDARAATTATARAELAARCRRWLAERFRAGPTGEPRHDAADSSRRPPSSGG